MFEWRIISQKKRNNVQKNEKIHLKRAASQRPPRTNFYSFNSRCCTSSLNPSKSKATFGVCSRCPVSKVQAIAYTRNTAICLTAPKNLLTQHVLTDGDVLVWGSPSRLRYQGVLPIKDGCHFATGACRINLTFRKVSSRTHVPPYVRLGTADGGL